MSNKDVCTLGYEQTETLATFYHLIGDQDGLKQ